MEKNFEVVEKMLSLSEGMEKDAAEQMIWGALGTVVSKFDGVGRELCRRIAEQKGVKRGISFQNLNGARTAVREQFDFDMADGLTEQEWSAILRSFQKRHVIAHRSGVVDEKYIEAASDEDAIIGRKIRVDKAEVDTSMRLLKMIANRLLAELSGEHGAQ